MWNWVVYMCIIADCSFIFYLIIHYEFGKMFNYKVVKNVIIDEHV